MTEAIRQGDIPGVQLRCRGESALSFDRVWELLTDPRCLESWLCSSASIDPVEGGEFEWRGTPELGADSVERGRLQTVVPGRLILASLVQPGWSATTRLELELSATAAGTAVSVLQNGFEHLPLSDSLTVWETYRRRWRSAFDRLVAVA